ncbi:MAG: amidohydrolase [Peptostreptococcaceae bacterium]|nr:amidohydrolase [Peptostreptococcaceae bacterium]
MNFSGATSIYFNGNIYTVGKDFTKANALVIKNDRLIYVGTDEIALRFRTENTSVIDLNGKTVLPGLIEGHTHFGWLSQSLVEIDALFKQKEDILEEVKKKAETVKPGEWILGRGWNNEIWEQSNFPTKEELDLAAPNNPVCIIRTCCHAYWVNSTALDLAKINKETLSPEGGEIIRHKDGSPAGVLVDTAGDQLTSIIPPYEGENQRNALLKGQEHLLEFGFTSIMDAGATVDEISAMKQLCETKKMDIRLYVYAKEGETANYYYKKGLEVGLYENHLTVRGIKFFADGSSGARSAYLLEDYNDRPGHKGNGRYTEKELYDNVREARINGFQISIHANGDGATEMVIDAYTKVLDELPLENNRYRIEHYQLLTPKHIEKAVEYKFIPSMQTVQCTSDRLMMEERMGKDSGRLERAYLWRDIIDAGLHIVNGSDAPVELVNPYHGFYAAVTRKGRDGQPEGGWYPNQCMTREEALKAATIWAAEAQFEENIKGSLEEGKLADFTVIDRDYMICDIEEIKDINAEMTVIGGKTVYFKE